VLAFSIFTITIVSFNTPSIGIFLWILTSSVTKLWLLIQKLDSQAY